MSNVHAPSQHVLAKSSFNVAITAATVNGASVDCLGFTRALAVLDTAPSGGGTTSQMKVQESANGSSGWADVANAITAAVATGSSGIYLIDLNLAKRLRFLRLVHIGAGGSAAGQAVGDLYLFNFEYKAPTQDQAVVQVL